METQEIIDIIELAIIIIGAVFGVMGAATETKTPTGNLTRWGKIALVGIIITSSFSFINNYLKQQKDREKEQKSQKDANKKLEEQNKQYKQEVTYLDSIINKSNKSIEGQIAIQKKTDSLLKSLNAVNKNVGINLSKQNELLIKEEEVNTNINRTLNPLLPMSLKINLEIDINSLKDRAIDVKLSIAHHNLKQIISKIRKDSVAADAKKYGLIAGNSNYLITSKYENFKDFLFLEDSKIEFFFLEKWHFDSLLNSKAPPGYIAQFQNLKLEANPKFVTNDISIFYSFDLEKFSFVFEISPIKVSENSGKYKSSLDLLNLDIFSKFYFFPSGTRFSILTLFFPPEKSNPKQYLLEDFIKKTEPFAFYRIFKLQEQFE